jgi:ApaG protein
MEVCTTNGITVRVETQYLPEHSNPAGLKFIFGYHIVIENEGSTPVQLMRRHWKIKDAHGSLREVEGPGVVGRQPLIQPGDRHEYISFCNLMTEVGIMKGVYLMASPESGATFFVEIPEFRMVAPFKLN